jgi:hypothetical protein
MWLYMIGGALVVLGIVVGAFGGGIFSIILIPLGVIALVSAAWYAMWARSAHRAAGAGTEAPAPQAEPLPHSPAGEGNGTGSVTTPDDLLDARREQQYR